LQHDDVSLQDDNVSLQYGYVSLQDENVSLQYGYVRLQRNDVRLQNDTVSLQHDDVSLQNDNVNNQNRVFGLKAGFYRFFLLILAGQEQITFYQPRKHKTNEKNVF
jgi:hypothetical protein